MNKSSLTSAFCVGMLLVVGHIEGMENELLPSTIVHYLSVSRVGRQETLTAMIGGHELLHDVKKALKQNPGLKIPDQVSQDILSIAVKLGDEKVAQIFLNRGVDPNQASGCPPGHYLLTEAAGKGHGKIVECLCAAGADPNQKNHMTSGFCNIIESLMGEHLNSAGSTVLHHAALWEREDIVRKLLAVGANPLISASGDKKPLDWAEASDNKSVAKLLEEAECIWLRAPWLLRDKPSNPTEKDKQAQQYVDEKVFEQFGESPAGKEIIIRRWQEIKESVTKHFERSLARNKDVAHLRVVLAARRAGCLKEKSLGYIPRDVLLYVVGPFLGDEVAEPSEELGIDCDTTRIQMLKILVLQDEARERARKG